MGIYIPKSIWLSSFVLIIVLIMIIIISIRYFLIYYSFFYSVWVFCSLSYFFIHYVLYIMLAATPLYASRAHRWGGGGVYDSPILLLSIVVIKKLYFWGEGGIFSSGDFSFECRVVVPSLDIVLNLPRTNEKLPCIGKPY